MSYIIISFFTGEIFTEMKYVVLERKFLTV